MKRQELAAVGLAGLLVIVGAAGGIRAGITGRAGQILFVPAADIEDAARRATPMIEVWSCEAGPAGQVVTGHVTGVEGNPVVSVTGDTDPPFGARIGRAYATDAFPFSFDAVGDFRVVIPWASGESIFAVQVPGAIAAHGPTARCPETPETE